MAQKLPVWQQSCSDPNKIPDRAVQLMQQMAISSNGSIMPSPLSASKSNLIISDPIPGAKPLPVPPELAPFVGVSIAHVRLSLKDCGQGLWAFPLDSSPGPEPSLAQLQKVFDLGLFI